MAIKLIALDIDGTLLNTDRKVLPSSINAIQKARAQGIKIVLTTGRPLLSTKPILKKLDLDNQDDQYLIILHGSVISTTSGKILEDNHIPYKEVKKVNQFIKIYPDIDLMIQNQEQMYLTHPDLNWYTSLESFKNKLTIHFRTDKGLEDESRHTKFYKMMFSGSKNRIDKLQKQLPTWLRKHLKVLRSEYCYIDMVNNKVDKGWAITQLIKKLNISPLEIMAIGDGGSDISMIQLAKYGVAMGNATPNLKKIANIVTADNNHDGIAKVINKYIA